MDTDAAHCSSCVEYIVSSTGRRQAVYSHLKMRGWLWQDEMLLHLIGITKLALYVTFSLTVHTTQSPPSIHRYRHIPNHPPCFSPRGKIHEYSGWVDCQTFGGIGRKTLLKWWEKFNSCSQGLKWYRVDNVSFACPLIIPSARSGHRQRARLPLSYSAIISRKSYLRWESSILEYMEEITRMMRSHHDSHLLRWCLFQSKEKREVGEMGSLEMPEWDPNDFYFMLHHVIFFLIRYPRVWLFANDT